PGKDRAKPRGLPTRPYPSPSRLFCGSCTGCEGTIFPAPHFLRRGRHPPFKTAPVADSQRSLATRCSKHAHARIAKGGGLLAVKSRISGTWMDNFEADEPTVQPGMAERAIDTATDVSRTINELSAALQVAVDRLGHAIITARQPGKPLSTISAITP